MCLDPFERENMGNAGTASLPFLMLRGRIGCIFKLMEGDNEMYPNIGRKAPASGAHIIPGRPNIFFVTVNAKDRQPWIGHSQVLTELVKVWKEKATAWLVGYFLLMPDHLHFFCAPYDLSFDIDSWITFWKRQFSKQHSNEDWNWQRKSFHHRIRDRIEYEEKLLYVEQKPVRKSFVQNATDWKLQGRVHDLRWTAD
jgi:putative transposase